MWRALCEGFPQITEASPEGVHRVALNDRHWIRWAGNSEEGSLACEVVDLAASEAWEAFVLRVDDESIRTGWRRSGGSEEPPDAWVEAALTLDMGEEVDARAEPDFAAIACVMSSDHGVAVSGEDLAVRKSLAAEGTHWRQVAAEQALKLSGTRSQSDPRPGAAALVAVSGGPHTWVWRTGAAWPLGAIWRFSAG
jgi:hypothetical protein